MGASAAMADRCCDEPSASGIPSPYGLGLALRSRHSCNPAIATLNWSDAPCCSIQCEDLPVASSSCGRNGKLGNLGVTVTGHYLNRGTR